jgi:hypothetical protein
MARLTVMDEIHLTLLVPRCLTAAQTQTIWQAINDAGFVTDLRRAVRRLVRRRPVLNKVRVRISR